MKLGISAYISLGFLVFMCGLAILAKWIVPFEFDEQNVERLLLSPNMA
jgi:ABC-type antimicrobial peptide transport system permease subunit